MEQNSQNSRLVQTERLLVCQFLARAKGTDLGFKQNDKLSFGKNETPFKRM